VENSGNWDGEYRFYYSSHQLIETRNGNDDVLKQYVWGTQYIDELIQVSANPDPADAGEDECEQVRWVAVDANYNVMALVAAAGVVRPLIRAWSARSTRRSGRCR